MSAKRLGATTHLGLVAVLIAILAASAAAAALLLWLITVLLPIAVGAGLIAYAAFRFRVGYQARTNPGF